MSSSRVNWALAAALGAVALASVAYLKLLPWPCGTSSRAHLETALNAVAGVAAAAATVMAFRIGGRVSLRYWAAGIGVGVLLAVFLFVVGLYSWVGNCTS